ncbi:MAG TPA: ECF-type sigma factor [Candidatus Polarisedimenticolia bacterium]|nr:ECF-type sigma factor [Candidatus Polarisedimenticolia bacterium]
MQDTISSLLDAADRGEPLAADALFAALYTELHQMAKRELAKNGAPTSLGASTLLHQTYLDIAGRDAPLFPDRVRFMMYAGRVMRGVVIDHVRRRHALKRGGRIEITAIRTDAAENLIDEPELTRLSDALDELAHLDAGLAQVVDLKYFCGFSFAEIAAMRNVSERTVQREWEKARIFLHRSIRADLTV